LILHLPNSATDEDGLAYLQYRPLDFFGLRDTTIGPLYHSSFIYDNGQISGYNPDRNNTNTGRVGSDQADPTMISKYQQVGQYLQDDILLKAEANVRNQWDQYTNPNAPGYSLPLHNCHDYTSAVLNEYNTLISQINAPSNTQTHKPSGK
jgi:hypothetical protein